MTSFKLSFCTQYSSPEELRSNINVDGMIEDYTRYFIDFSTSEVSPLSNSVNDVTVIIIKRKVQIQKIFIFWHLIIYVM